MATKRMSSVKGSATVKLNDKLAKMAGEGIKVISFSVGEPDFTTPKNIIEAAKSALDDGFTHYTPSGGIPELRKAISEKLKNENKIDMPPANILVTPTKFAIYAAINAHVEKGHEVLLSNPAWVSYDPSIAMAGAKTVLFDLDKNNDFKIDEESIKNSISPKTKMIILNSPSNPTGGVMTKKEMALIRDIAVDNNLIVLSDEIYEKLVYEGEHISPGSLEGMQDRTITINGFSKSYAMTGWRMGWLAAPKHLFKDIMTIQQHTITCAVSFAQKAAVEALTGDQSSIKIMKKEFQSRRDLMYSYLKEIPGFKPNTPAGAFYIFPSFEADMTSEELSIKILEKAHVGVTPGSAFGSNGEGHLRFSYATSKEKIEHGMEAIKKFMEEL